MDVREKLSNEKWLIDANALLDEFLKQYTERERDGNLVFAACEIKQDFADMISNVPNVDAVEVVRCRECKQGEIDDQDFPNQYYCHAGCGWNNGDFYCYYGERKEGAD